MLCSHIYTCMYAYKPLVSISGIASIINSLQTIISWVLPWVPLRYQLVSIKTKWFYNALMAANSWELVFYVLIPSLMGGIDNLIAPALINEKSLLFPRIGGISFWLLVYPCFLQLLSLFANHWSFLRLNRDSIRNIEFSINFSISAMLLACISALMVAVNYTYTVLNGWFVHINPTQMPLLV